MRTALAYLTSLICHGIVFVPLAHLAVTFETRPPTFSVNAGGAAVLKASSSGPENDGDGQEGQEVQVVLETSSQIEPPTPERDCPNFRLSENETDDLIAPDTFPLMPEVESTDFHVALPTPRVALDRSNSEKINVEKPADKTPTALPKNSKLAGSGNSTGNGTSQGNGNSSGNSSGGANGTGIVQGASASGSNPTPPYPAEALAHGIEGLVYLRVKIGSDGSVESASVHQSSGDASLDASALSTVRRYWRFQPATQGGEAIPFEALLPIRFTIRAG